MPGRINADKENAIRILDYWFLMEFLNQQSISVLKEKENTANTYKTNLKTGNIRRRKKVVEDVVPFKPGDNLQNIAMTATEEMQLPLWSDFTVFIGTIKKETCIQKIAQNILWNGQSPDKNYDEITLATLNFSKEGNYIVNSLSISPLAWAMKKLSGGTSNASQKLSINDYNSDTRAVRSVLELYLTLREKRLHHLM